MAAGSAAGAALRAWRPAAGAAARLVDAVPRPVVDDIFACALKKQTGVSLKYMLDFGANPIDRQLRLSAQFLHNELPVRLAHRVAELENLPYGLSAKAHVLKVRESIFFCLVVLVAALASLSLSFLFFRLSRAQKRTKLSTQGPRLVRRILHRAAGLPAHPRRRRRTVLHRPAAVDLSPPPARRARHGHGRRGAEGGSRGGGAGGGGGGGHGWRRDRLWAGVHQRRRRRPGRNAGNSPGERIFSFFCLPPTPFFFALFRCSSPTPSLSLSLSQTKHPPSVPGRLLPVPHRHPHPHRPAHRPARAAPPGLHRPDLHGVRPARRRARRHRRRARHGGTPVRRVRTRSDGVRRPGRHVCVRAVPPPPHGL
jgi:hypothetical protein